MGWADHHADVTDTVNALAHRFALVTGIKYTKTKLTQSTLAQLL